METINVNGVKYIKADTSLLERNEKLEFKIKMITNALHYESMKTSRSWPRVIRNIQDIVNS